ncbi:MAG: alpha/beta hydrolase [Clostridiales bacterium]|nr:alpha/beta hydrolase [Clostridiales bacterium]
MNEVKREEFWYDSRDEQTKIHAVRWVPACEKKKAVVQLVHGMTEHVMRYDAFAQFLAEQGILVVANDHLGHGLSRRADMPYGYFCRRDPATVVVRDVHRLKKITQENNPGVPYIILGHSMGSFILRNYLSRYGTGIQGAVIVGTGHPSAIKVNFGLIFARIQSLIFGQKHVAKLLDSIIFSGYNAKSGQNRTESDWLNSQSEEVDLYRDDPMCGYTFTLNGFITLFTLIKRACGKEAFKKVPADLPVLFLSGKEDPVGGCGKEVERAYGSFCDREMTEVSCKLYEGGRHEILREKNKDEVFADILEFINRIIAAK